MEPDSSAFVQEPALDMDERLCSYMGVPEPPPERSDEQIREIVEPIVVRVGSSLSGLAGPDRVGAHYRVWDFVGRLDGMEWVVTESVACGLCKETWPCSSARD